MGNRNKMANNSFNDKQFDTSKIDARLRKVRPIKSNVRKNRDSKLLEVIGEIKDCHSLASVPYSYRLNLPASPGVYVVYFENKVFYVGQSTNLRKRFSAHEVLFKIDEAVNRESLLFRIGWILVSESHLDFVERYLIGTWQPDLNINNKPVAGVN